MGWTYTDRFGNQHYTIEGMRWLAQQAIAAYGYITLDSFEDGNTLTLPNQVLRLEATGEYYRWDGAFPKYVPAGSTPATTGGVGLGAWVSVADAALRSDLAKKDGLKHIGSCESVTELRAIEGTVNGQQIFLTSVLPGKNTGGGIFQWDSSSTKTDDSGCIIQPTSTTTGRWIRQGVVEKTPEMFGAIGDGKSANDTSAIQAMFYSGFINKDDDLDRFYGCYRLSGKYLITHEIETYWVLNVDASGAHFIFNESITGFSITSLRNGVWRGGHFDYSGVPNSLLNENAVALWPMKYVNSVNYTYLQLMHSKITGVKTTGVHTGIKITDGTGYTWMSEIELCEFGVRPGVSTKKARAIDIEATGPSGGGSTTLSLRKISTQDFTNSPVGVGRAGFRIWNISGVKIFDCSMDNASVGGRDVLEIFANSVEINGFHTERLVNTSSIGTDSPFTILGNTVFIDGIILIEKSTIENCSWFSVYNGGSGSAITVGNLYQTTLSGATEHIEYFLDNSRDQKNSVNLIGGVRSSQVYGTKGRQLLLSAENNQFSVWSLVPNIATGSPFLNIPGMASSYEIAIRGDCVSDSTIAFYGIIKIVRSKAVSVWSIKYDIVNTELTFPSTTYPISIGVSGNQLVFTVPSSLRFDVQVKFINMISDSSSY